MARSAAVLARLLRNHALARVLGAWLLGVLAEYAVWVGMLVFAFAHGGTTTAGVVCVAQLVPGVVAAPWLAALVDRHSPVRLLVVGYLAQTVGMALTATAVYLGAPAVLAYAAAVVASTAVSVTRPAQSVAMPGLAREADELTAANAAVGWLENVGIVASGVLTGLALAHGSPGLIFAAGAAATLVGAAALAGVRSDPLSALPDEPAAPTTASPDSGPTGALAGFGQGLAVLRDLPAARVLVSILAAEFVVVGALDVLFVVLAISVLGEGAQWSGYLNTAYGAGGVAAGALAVALLGRRLSGPVVASAAVLCAALALTAFSSAAGLTVGLLVVVGVGRSVLDIAANTLLQRTVPPDRLGRIVGVVEAVMSGGLAIGAVLVPALSAIGGARAALIGTATLVPLAALAGGRAVMHLDSTAQVPITEIALLRSMDHFRALPTPELEGLAGALDRREVAPGTTIIRQGEPGEEFYAIAEGQVSIFVDGEFVARRARPDGLGEIALLHDVPRSATVVADGPVVLYGLDGATFRSVVTGHDATRRRAHAVADGHTLAPGPTGGSAG